MHHKLGNHEDCCIDSTGLDFGSRRPGRRGKETFRRTALDKSDEKRLFDSCTSFSKHQTLGNTFISVPNREYCQGIHVGLEKLAFWPCSFFFRAKFEIVYLLKTAQRSKKGMGYAIPKENIDKI